MDTVFFIASKLIGALLQPDTWIVIVLAAVVVSVVFHRRRFALWFGSGLLCVLVVLSVFPLGDRLLQPVERSIGKKTRTFFSH